MSGRQVKCTVTGEYGTSDSFVKIEGKWYQSQEVYEAAQKKREERRVLIDYVCREFLGYGEGQPFSTFLPRKLQTLQYYDDALILQVFRQQANVIHERFSALEFPNEMQKISYMVGIVRNALPDAKRKLEREQRQSAKVFAGESFEPEPHIDTPIRRGKDLSNWLEGGDL